MIPDWPAKALFEALQRRATLNRSQAAAKGASVAYARRSVDLARAYEQAATRIAQVAFWPTNDA